MTEREAMSALGTMALPFKRVEELYRLPQAYAEFSMIAIKGDPGKAQRNWIQAACVKRISERKSKP
jgi:hypothetical protein